MTQHSDLFWGVMYTKTDTPLHETKNSVGIFPGKRRENAVIFRKIDIFERLLANICSKTVALVSKWSDNDNLALRHFHAKIEVKRKSFSIILAVKCC